ncbi:amine oxidase [Natronosporangium hydrolyticum]|uniref:Amine oxidase n=1 Tax=Natronosporangium hydrolyticum TaxID=2811111 RepID=A0A895YEY5_9ACTN|nr:DUF6328 family protein [Natronosporangium hydrolyticum]QSB16141.1 amine oxidase [Natronosporangium hydrolyticum]
MTEPVEPPDLTASTGPAGETDLQRWQRNFNELLQELRVAQTGVQILFAFLLILAFTPGFAADADAFARSAYLVALLSATAAAALIIAPVAYHRVLFRRGHKPELVVYAHRMAFGGLMMVLVSIVSALLLATDVVLPRVVAVLVSAAAGIGFVLLWAVFPFLRRRAGD